MGPSRGTHQVVVVQGDGAQDRAVLAERIADAMRKLAAADAPFRLEYWATDEAQKWFRERAGTTPRGSCASGARRRCGSSPAARCYALSMGPLLPTTGRLHGLRAATRTPTASRSASGKRDPRNGGGTPRRPRPPRRRPGARLDMAEEHQRWLAAMGVTSVGAFNELCISGQVSQLIRVAEGFHEKRIGHIADEIAAARDRIRIISIAGPSSSGKTTFIKRLTVQLQIDGVNPVGISLDDYYVDREKTPRAADGDWDFEALEALDLGAAAGPRAAAARRARR